MKREIRLALYVGLLVALAGCAPLKPGRMELAAVEVETVPTSIVSVSRADVYLENGRLVVTGRLRRMHEVKMPGHVDIVVCGPAGLLEHRSLPVPGLASKRNGLMDLPFKAKFNLLPQPGSKIKIRYHSSFGRGALVGLGPLGEAPFKAGQELCYKRKSPAPGQRLESSLCRQFEKGKSWQCSDICQPLFQNACFAMGI